MNADPTLVLIELAHLTGELHGLLTALNQETRFTETQRATLDNISFRMSRAVSCYTAPLTPRPQLLESLP